jgi:hypothetical protein
VHLLSYRRAPHLLIPLLYKFTLIFMLTNEYDKEQEQEPCYSMDEYLSGIDIESIRDDAGTLNGLVPSQINNIVKARDVKFQLHEFTAQMNEVFPRCHQSMELRFQLVEDGGMRDPSGQEESVETGLVEVQPKKYEAKS